MSEILNQYARSTFKSMMAIHALKNGTPLEQVTRQMNMPLPDRFEVSINNMIQEWKERYPEATSDRMQRGRLFVESIGVAFLKELNQHRDPTAALLASRQDKEKKMIWSAIDQVHGQAEYGSDVKLMAFQGLLLEASTNAEKTALASLKSVFDGQQDKKSILLSTAQQVKNYFQGDSKWKGACQKIFEKAQFDTEKVGFTESLSRQVQTLTQDATANQKELTGMVLSFLSETGGLGAMRARRGPPNAGDPVGPSQDGSRQINRLG